ncbi:hypothetical protein QFW77_03280 [Luteimonas sp. RD2P54]|uniref:Uncharacterized protein n=1 Tax=Luteimonas endophytica TaxID=3042023 RepID=A0ABT6J5B4_9GAMM|nr:hypothetical protein [Luteimonas endophytica]MDH5822017.1 hypothetical protein [Luteimonas endophytica]
MTPPRAAAPATARVVGADPLPGPWPGRGGSPVTGSATRLRVAALAGLLALAVSGCGSDRGPDQGEAFVGTYAGDPYTGFVEVEVRPAGGRAWRQHGEGSAHFVDEGGGKARLVVFGAIDDENGDAGFAIDGAFTDGRWKSETEGVSLEIDRDGRIGGGGTMHPQRFDFSGTATATDFALDVGIELLEDNPQSLPAGSTFRFAYELSRAEPGKDAEQSAGEDEDGRGGDRKCRRIRYEMRPVANIGDGSMSMIQVPVCLE